MAIQMTRAEYEAKYGSQAQGTSMPTTTPKAPVQMTRAEYEAKYGSKVPTTTEPGFIQSSVQAITRPVLGMVSQARDIGGAIADVGRVLGGGEAQNVSTGPTDYNYGYLGTVPSFGAATPDKAGAQAMLRGAGAGLGMASLIPMGGAVGATGGTLLKGTLPKALGLAKEGALGGAMYGAGSSMQEGEDLGKTLESTVAGGVIGGVATPLIGAGVPFLGKMLAKKGRETFTEAGKSASAVEHNTKVLNTLSDSYKVVKNVDEKSAARGVDVKKTLANSDLLVDSVDNTGTINTENARAELQKFISDGPETVISDTLKKEGKSIDPELLKAQMKADINNSTLTGTRKQAALNKVDAEVDGLKLDATPDGKIPLLLIHKAKSDIYSTINYLGDPAGAKADKLIAKSLKETVEKNTTSADVKALNKELTTHYAVMDYLNKINGKKIEGGRLGKHFARVTGAIVGSHFGPLGSIAGSEIAGGIKGLSMRGTLSKKTGNVLRSSEAMQKAIKANQSSKSVGNLNIPQNKTIINTTADITPSITSKPEVKSVLPRGGNFIIGDSKFLQDIRSKQLPKERSVEDTAKRLGVLNQYKEELNKAGREAQKKAGVSFTLPNNLKITDAYPKDYLGMNMKELERLAKEQNYPLYDKLIKNVDSQIGIEDKLKAIANIYSELQKNKFKNLAGAPVGLGIMGTSNQDIKFGEKDIKETKTGLGKYKYERTQEPTAFDGDSLIKAIANNETGTTTIKNPYTFSKWSDPMKGPKSKYGKDLGKYQITSARLKEKAEAFLGKKVSDEEFLKNPSLQDKFMKEEILWLKNLGLTPEEILAVHRHGWGDLSKEAINKAKEARKKYINNAISFIKSNK